MSTQFTRCWAEIDGSALASNVATLKRIGPEIIAVVKANAYGHGVDLVVPILLSSGVRHFSVATVDEAAELRGLPGMSESSIYLMAAVTEGDADRVAALDLIPFATDDHFVQALADSARKFGKTAKIHVEVDTGIGRAGISPAALPETFAKWQSLENIQVTGICTHFTAADAAGADDSRAQQHVFKSAIAALPESSRQGLAIHAANSPAALRLPPSISTLFRPGLLLYGIPPSEQLAVNFPYHPVLSLNTRILLVRRLPAGTDISYSRTYKLPNDATIATIGIGYGDGYPRRLSSIGRVLLKDGTSAPIRGRICMDQFCVELPEGSEAKPGDTVTLIGKAGNNTITVNEIADQIDTTPHEITTCLTQRVPRVLR
jgi:alanine racemase